MRLGLSRKDVDDELAKGPPNKALGQESSSPTPVKTTIRLPRRLWRDVRIRALDEGRDFQEVVAAALELYLKTTKREGAR